MRQISGSLTAAAAAVSVAQPALTRGRWATVMPISVFKDPATAQGVVISEISGVQLNRLLVLATRIENLGNSPQAAIREIIESEFSRLARAGMFSFSTSAGS